MAACSTVDVQCPACGEALLLPIKLESLPQVRREVTINVTADEPKWREIIDGHLSRQDHIRG